MQKPTATVLAKLRKLNPKTQAVILGKVLGKIRQKQAQESAKTQK